MKKQLCIRLMIAFVGLFFLSTKVISQQLPQFSQYVFNGLYVNPAYAGYKNDLFLHTTYRNQWNNFPGAPKTLSVSADFSAEDGRMGYGISFLNDKLGPTESNIGLLTYSYRVQMGRKSFLGLGVSTGFSDYRLNGNLLYENDPNDPLIPEDVVRKVVPNLNSGLFFYNEEFYAGFSVFNMIGRSALRSEDVALAYHDFHYYLTAGAMLYFSDDLQFKPSFLIKHAKGSPSSLDLNGMFFLKERLWIGGSFRSNVRFLRDDLGERAELNNRTAIVGLFELFVTKNMSLGYSYDHNLNALSNFRASSHEFSIGYYIRSDLDFKQNTRLF
jgi:type IX secretion system PorP/SprF family membrane protein